MKRIVVRCPVCNAQKNEVITDKLIELRKSIDRGLVLLKISQNVVCDHSFYIEIDKNYSIRDSFPLEVEQKLTPKDMPYYVSLEDY